MKLFNLFQYEYITVGISSFTIIFNCSINKFAFVISLTYENEEYNWLLEIVDFRGQYARTPASERFPTKLKFKMSDDRIYNLAKKNNWELPSEFFYENQHLFPTQEQMESELITINPFRFFTKNIWVKS